LFCDFQPFADLYTSIFSMGWAGRLNRKQYALAVVLLMLIAMVRIALTYRDTA
jgi:hypothetical protein